MIWLLVLVPISVVADFVLHNEVATFLLAAGAIIPLASLMGSATEQLALHAGPRAGGLLNATFGNVAELIIAAFLIARGEFDVVKASLTGSILGNLLLVLGLSMLVGGLRHPEQRFSARAAGVHSSQMNLAVIGLLMPALFALTVPGGGTFVQREVVSATVAVVLMALYVAALAFMFVTHVHVFHMPEAGERPTWSLRRALAVLVVAAAFVALESEMLVGSLDRAASSLGLSKVFIGLILVPVVGNAAEHASAVLFAWRNKMDVALEIAIGSSTQIALFVAPALIFLSLLLGHPMDFVFRPFEIVAVGLASVIVAGIAQDGLSNWLEGAQLLGAYLIMAVSFLFLRG